jgi:hypothetical protein
MENQWHFPGKISYMHGQFSIMFCDFYRMSPKSWRLLMGEPLFLGYFVIYAMISYGFPLGCLLLLGQQFEFQDKAGMIIVIQHIYKALKTHRRIVNAKKLSQLEEWDPPIFGTDYICGLLTLW